MLIEQVTFGVSLRLLMNSLQGKPFTGEITGENETGCICLRIPLMPGAARDIVERRVKLAVEASFSNGQIVGFAFCGKGVDEIALVLLVTGEPTLYQVSNARQALLDIDTRSRTFYPVRLGHR